MNPANGASLSTSKSNSTLRPRTRRLISVEDDMYAGEGSDDATSRRQSAITSRNASPTPTPHPGAGPRWRLNATSEPASSFVRATSAQHPKTPRSSANTLSGIWGNSWSAIQGIAATVIGNEGSQADASGSRRRRPAHDRRTSVSAPPPKQWGPAGSSSHVGAGTHEERENMVRAMKRKDLLTANEHLVPDSVGRIKRRNSDERLSASAPPCENDDRDALVYIHKVSPQDTLAGLSIKYNCDHAVLRKSNRMWPNDSVQTKKVIVLPVDACGVKGRPAHGPDPLPEEDHLLGVYGESSGSKLPETQEQGLPNGWTVPRKKDADTNSAASSNREAEPPWKHDSWVLLANDKQPVQIGRMPRRALGFFPPARRKSLAYSDASTPRASIDLPRSSTSTNTVTSSPAAPARPRASSNLSTVSTHSRQRNASGTGWGLHGPGGVGTMGRNVRTPGPAPDGLNKKFAQYLPNMAPPPGQEYFTPWAASLLDQDSGVSHQFGGSGAITPIHGTGVDLQEIGGAIEGWVRKVGSQAQKILSEPGTPGGRRSGKPPHGAVGGDLGDLIELQDDAFEIGDDERERGRARTNNPPASIDQRSGSIRQQFQTSRPDINLVLTDRRRRGDNSKND
ncbi:hypothetical protein BDU57DRAFT_349214 [Ampelomyces quisqualis]|uniref:LysM domain-containing protein n=1 Tax=Ampelomyces quisqualis TaxID=50730 RepID=A0A6A5QCC0_AMPQU|nr:hypothetical protein BDU57DRAFT_349214 [Ampelomyces quisqualis]